MKIKILLNNFTQSPIEENFIDYAQKAADIIFAELDCFYEIGLNVVDEEQIQALNEEYRSIDEPTDVLSFVLNDEDIAQEKGYIYLGDVIICLNIAKKQAKEYGHSLLRELVYLFVHSVLHMIGFDHIDEQDKQKMRAKEEEIMKQISLKR